MRRVLAVVSALAIAVGGAIAFAGPSTAEDPLFADKGTIELKTSWTRGEVTYQGQTTRFSSGCNRSTGALVVTGVSGTTCFGTAGFGDGIGGNTWYLNPDVRPGEALTLTPGGAAAGLQIYDFSFDIEATNTDGGDGDDILIEAKFGSQVQEIPIDLDAIGRVPGIALPNYRVDLGGPGLDGVSLTVPAEALVLSSLNGTVFQLEGDTAPSTLSLTEVLTVEPGGSLALEDGSGAVASVTNNSGQTLPVVTEDCPKTTEVGPCVAFEVVGDPDQFFDITVYISTPAGDSDSQDMWATRVDLDGDGLDFEFDPNLLDSGCQFGDFVNIDGTPKKGACIVEFRWPDDKSGLDPNNPELAGDDSGVDFRTAKWLARIKTGDPFWR